MSKSEFDNTIKNGKPTFIKRYKWFTPSLEFLINRICDGKFNNSNFVPRYTHIIKWDIPKSHLQFFDKVSSKELMLDRRKANQITFCNALQYLFTR